MKVPANLGSQFIGGLSVTGVLKKVLSSNFLFQWTVINRDSSSYFPLNLGMTKVFCYPKDPGLCHISSYF